MEKGRGEQLDFRKLQGEEKCGGKNRRKCGDTNGITSSATPSYLDPKVNDSAATNNHRTSAPSLSTAVW
nr:unnamed protein product [Digitaria exilis]